ncbi:GNAT family N-acetyltransferase [Streptomyces sp. NPDC002926]
MSDNALHNAFFALHHGLPRQGPGSEQQRKGAGQAVVRAVLDLARVRGERLVLVLGHPDHYPRFGFEPAERYGIRPTFEVADEPMMVLVPDGSGGVPRGMIRCPAAFGV